MSQRATLLSQSKTAQAIVSQHGIGAWLIVLAAAIMSFLMLYAMSLGMVASGVASDWRQALNNSATIRIQAPIDQREAETLAVLEVLRTTGGIEDYEQVSKEEQLKLLEPWLGADIPAEVLNLPIIFRVETIKDFDDQSIVTRLSAEAPNAVWDDHIRWRGPLFKSASRISKIAWFSTTLIGIAFALMIYVAADASTAANAVSIRLLRQVGATDQWIRLGFERKFVLRALAGSAIGAFFGITAYYFIVRAQLQNSQLGGTNASLSTPFFSAFMVVVLCGVLSYIASRVSASRYLLKNT